MGGLQLVDALHRENLATLRDRFDLVTVAGIRRPRGGDDEVYVVAPEFGSIAATEALRLFDRLRQLLDQRGDVHVFDTDDGERIGVLSGGSASRGGYLLGEGTGPAVPTRRNELIAAAAGLGHLVHSLEASLRRPDDVDLSVRVAPEGGARRVTVRISDAGRALIESTVIGPEVASAAAVAAARTLDVDARILMLRCMVVERAPMIVAAVASGAGTPSMAMAPARPDRIAGAARAAYRAMALAT